MFLINFSEYLFVYIRVAIFLIKKKVLYRIAMAYKYKSVYIF